MLHLILGTAVVVATVVDNMVLQSGHGQDWRWPCCCTCFLLLLLFHNLLKANFDLGFLTALSLDEATEANEVTDLLRLLLSESLNRKFSSISSPMEAISAWLVSFIAITLWL